MEEVRWKEVLVRMGRDTWGERVEGQAVYDAGGAIWSQPCMVRDGPPHGTLSWAATATAQISPNSVPTKQPGLCVPTWTQRGGRGPPGTCSLPCYPPTKAERRRWQEDKGQERWGGVTGGTGLPAPRSIFFGLEAPLVRTKKPQSRQAGRKISWKLGWYK